MSLSLTLHMVSYMGHPVHSRSDGWLNNPQTLLTSDEEPAKLTASRGLRWGTCDAYRGSDLVCDMFLSTTVGRHSCYSALVLVMLLLAVVHASVCRGAEEREADYMRQYVRYDTPVVEWTEKKEAIRYVIYPKCLEHFAVRLLPYTHVVSPPPSRQDDIAPTSAIRQPASHRAREDANASPPDGFGRSPPSNDSEWDLANRTLSRSPARRRSQVRGARHREQAV